MVKVLLQFKANADCRDEVCSLCVFSERMSRCSHASVMGHRRHVNVTGHEWSARQVSADSLLGTCQFTHSCLHLTAYCCLSLGHPAARYRPQDCVIEPAGALPVAASAHRKSYCFSRALQLRHSCQGLFARATHFSSCKTPHFYQFTCFSFVYTCHEQEVQPVYAFEVHSAVPFAKILCARGIAL